MFWSYLCFGEVQLPCELSALAPHHVLAPLKLEFETIQLLCSEGGPRALGPVQVEPLWQDDLPDGAFGVCPETKNNKHKISGQTQTHFGFYLERHQRGKSEELTTPWTHYLKTPEPPNSAYLVDGCKKNWMKLTSYSVNVCTMDS